MNSTEYIKDIIKSQKNGIAKGIYSVCTANEFVIKAVIKKAQKDKSFVLIESTCNQVNQFGGYTGMRPEDFKNFIYNIARKIGFPIERLILGGDHLGPNPWKNEDANSAMQKAGTLIEEYILAGYIKIHIDTSMHLENDPGKGVEQLDNNLIARRGAELALQAENAYQKLKKVNPQAEPPLYVIGSEVPVPGGTEEKEEEIKVTSPKDLKETITLFKNYFNEYNLQDAWERVIGIVVQPGVEFGTDYVLDYNREKASDLSSCLDDYQNIVFEAHSTDYQKRDLLKQMVEDGFCILKVGPALTFALREALFALEYIERELLINNREELSSLQNTLDRVMSEDPTNWVKYYDGGKDEIRLARKYSLSDRIRYYWTKPEVTKAVNMLIDNLESREIPLILISQFMPVQYKRIRKGLLNNEVMALIEDKIVNVISDYDQAVET